MNKKFSFQTIKDFDEHICKSIPNYDLLSDGVKNLSGYFLRNDGIIYDVGCSTGKLLESIPFKGKKVGIDNSSNLLPQSHDNIKYDNIDLNQGYDFSSACLVISLFTLQFLGKKEREMLVDDIYKGLSKGDAFIYAEKVYSKDGKSQELMTFSHYDFKINAFPLEEIIDKERDLRQIMKPNTTEDNIEMIQEAGFKSQNMFWKFFNFEGWICIK